MKQSTGRQNNRNDSGRKRTPSKKVDGGSGRKFDKSDKPSYKKSNDKGKPGFKKSDDGVSSFKPKRTSTGGFDKKSSFDSTKKGPSNPSFKRKEAEGSNIFRPDSFVRKTRPVYEEIEPTKRSSDGTVRLNKFIANSGVCSRRDADTLILEGKIKVNGQITRELGTKVMPTDNVTYKGRTLIPEKKTYILLNKPKDCVTTNDDPEANRTVFDLLKGAGQEQLHAVGRLDRNTTGVLLLTNDGELTQKLTHPKFGKKKIYHVWIDKNISDDHMRLIKQGIELEEDGIVKADDISFVEIGDRKQVGIELHTGQNRIVRRIFEALDYKVEKLDRVYFAGLTKKGLPRGDWRYLTNEEVTILKRISSK